MNANGIGPLLFSEEERFLRELNAGDSLTVDLSISGLSDDGRKWSMRHQIWRGEEVCAIIEADGAWLDLRRRRVSIPPADLLQLIDVLAQTEDFRVL